MFEKPKDMEQETWDRLHKTDAERAAEEGYAIFPTDSRAGHRARAMFGLASWLGHGWSGFAVADSHGGLDVRETEEAMDAYEAERAFSAHDTGPSLYAGIRPSTTHETGTGRIRWEIRHRDMGPFVLTLQVCRPPEVILPRRVVGSVVVIELELLLDGTDTIESLYVDEGLAEGRHHLAANDAMVAATGHPAPEAIFLAATRERFEWILGCVEAGHYASDSAQLTAVLSHVEDHLDYLTDFQRQRFEHAARVLKEK